jgi:hypothetical protein
MVGKAHRPEKIKIFVYDPFDARFICGGIFPYWPRECLKGYYRTMAKRFLWYASKYGDVGIRKPKLYIELIYSL